VSANKRSDFGIEEFILIDFHHIDVHSYLFPVNLLESMHGLIETEFAIIKFKDKNESSFNRLIISTH